MADYHNSLNKYNKMNFENLTDNKYWMFAKK